MFEQDWGRILESYNDYVASQNYGITSKTIAYKIRTTTFRIGAVAYGDNGVPYYTQANGYDVTFTEIIYEGSSYSMSWSISNQDGSLEYCESGKSIDGKWLVDNREFNVTTAEGVNQDQWLTGLQIALDTYGTFDQGLGGMVAGIASGMIDVYRGNYVWGTIALAASIPIAGIVFDAMKQGRNAEKVGKNLKVVSESINPFIGKTGFEIENMFLKKGFVKKGVDPMNGLGGYVNTKSGYSYHIDYGIDRFGNSVEVPHIDINYPHGTNLPKQKWPWRLK